jgi:GTPase SAR1 family protein
MEKPLKVLFVGDSKSGKTQTCKNLLYFDTHGPYKPTYGTEIYKYITKNNIEINIWDCAGDNNYKGLGDAYYINADICVVFGNNKEQWIRNVKLFEDKVIIYPFSGIKDLRNFFDSIDNGKPVGHVSDDNITVINIFG